VGSQVISAAVKDILGRFCLKRALFREKKDGLPRRIKNEHYERGIPIGILKLQKD